MILVSRLQQAVRKYRRELAQEVGDNQNRAVLVARRMDAAVVKILQQGDARVDQPAVTRTLQAMRKTIAAGSLQMRSDLERVIPELADLSFRRSSEITALTLGATRWEEVTDSRALDAFAKFERNIADRSIIRASNGYLERWQADWSAEWEAAARGVQASFTRAMVTGQTHRQIAAGLVDELGRLKIAGRVNSEDFARAFIRTANGELYQDLGLQLATEAGLDQFVNIGVPDEAQSQECYAASNWGAHTMPEWEASPWGPPKRHVYN